MSGFRDQEVYITGSHGTVLIEETVLGRLPLSGHCTDGLKHTPSLSEKSLLCLSRNFGLRGRLLIWETYRVSAWRIGRL